MQVKEAAKEDAQAQGRQMDPFASMFGLARRPSSSFYFKPSCSLHSVNRIRGSILSTFNF